MPQSNPTLQFATKILKDIQDKIQDPERLSTEQRRICVRFMVHEQKYTKTEMAEILHVARQTIYDDQKALARDEAGASLMIDEIEMIRELLVTAETAKARLFRKGKEKEAFEVQDKLIDRLQSLGYVRRVAQEHNFKGAVSLLEVLTFEHSMRTTQPVGDSYGENGNGRDHENGSRFEDAPS